MNQCTYCGMEIPEGKKACQPCRDNLISKVWKRQIRAYGLFIALGLALLVYAWFQFAGHHYTISDAPLVLKAATVMGGLGLMGGSFGLMLAVFFHLWHGRSR